MAETTVDEKFEIIGCENSDSEKIVRPTMTYWQDAWRRLKSNNVAMISIVILIALVVMTIIGPHLTPYTHEEMIVEERNMAPSSEHWFGTDELGRDIFTRVWKGGRVSMLIGVVGAFVASFVGCIYGGIAAYFGGTVDDIMMRIVEILVSIPYLIVVILISVLTRSKGMGSILLALCITGWCGTARLVRGQILQLKEKEFVIAAKALGVSDWKIITRHLIPNTLG